MVLHVALFTPFSSVGRDTPVCRLSLTLLGLFSSSMYPIWQSSEFACVFALQSGWKSSKAA
jgi:hypothetical protein